MIRDILILQHNGILLFHHNFGECSSFGKDIDIFSGFLAAIQSFSLDMIGSKINYLELDDKSLFFHKSESLTYVLISDRADSIEEIKAKSKKIANLFESRYLLELSKFHGEISQFKPFADQLIEFKITTKNCGKHPDCTACPNNLKVLPLEKIIEKIIQKE
jgi:hypothetical protein